MDEAQKAAVYYPPSIVRWEMKHGVVRTMVDEDMMYIGCMDFDAFNRQIAEEKAEQRRKWLNQKIAEQQAAAYEGSE